MNHFKYDNEHGSSGNFPHLQQAINENLDTSPRSAHNDSPVSNLYNQKFPYFNQINNSNMLSNVNKLNQISSDDSESNRFKFKCSLKNRYFQNK